MVAVLLLLMLFVRVLAPFLLFIPAPVLLVLIGSTGFDTPVTEFFLSTGEKVFTACMYALHHPQQQSVGWVRGRLS